MIWPDSHIIKAGETLISPFKQENVQAASVDLVLGTDFLEPDPVAKCVDLKDVQGTHRYREIVAPIGFMLLPQSFVLGTTVETIKVPTDTVARIEGKSSLARLGAGVHITAGFCDPGFEGRVTLEFFNFSRWAIMLRPGRRICQIAFEQLIESASIPYGSKELGSHYQGQTTTTGSRYEG